MLKTNAQALGKSAKLQKTVKRLQVLLKKGRLAEAKRLGDKTQTQGAQDPEFLHIYGMTLKTLGHLEDALVKIFAAHELDPENASILNSLGLVFLDMKDIETAIEMFKRATTTDEKLYAAWTNLGNTLRIVERFNAAELAYKCAYFLEPSDPSPLFDIALMHVDMRRYMRAAEIMDELLETHANITTGMKLKRLQIAMRLEDMDYVKAHLGEFEDAPLSKEDRADLEAVKAQWHIIYDQYEDAIAILEKTIASKTSNQADHLTHLGFLYGLAGRLDDGIKMLKKVLRNDPGNAAARHNLALLQFRNGELEEGFKNYPARIEISEFSSKRRRFDMPVWRGEPIANKKILVWREQGIGDEVRFASLLPELQELGASVTFECSPKLIPLWEKSFPWAEVRQEGKVDCKDDPEYQGFDFHIPIGSLGFAFRNSLEDFRQKQKPWIARNPEAETQIRSQLGIGGQELLIGICWRSSLQVASRDKIFLNCEELAPLRDLPNARWLNVQYSSDADELAKIRELGLNMHHFTDLDQMNDLVGACNLIGACDLVISVGVSVGDLAGGIGTPMVHIGPESSEIYLGTEGIPWFVNAKSYRLKAFQAEEAIAEIVNDWDEISNWANGFKSEERKAGMAASDTQTPPPLDLEYSAKI